MLKMKMFREKNANADLDVWEFGMAPGALNSAINKEIQERLDAVFSENGADVYLSIYPEMNKPEELLICCEICIEECDAYATGTGSLRSLLLLQAECLNPLDRNRLAEALRDLAKELTVC